MWPNGPPPIVQRTFGPSNSQNCSNTAKNKQISTTSDESSTSDLKKAADNQASEVRFQLSSKQKYLATASLATAVFMGSMDRTILATTLPTIANSFNDITKSSWVITANLVTSTCFLPLYGKLSDIFGKKQMLLMAITIVLIGSIISSTVKSLNMLIFSRALTGLGSAGVIVTVQIVISEIVTIRERGKYSGFISLSFGLSSVVGPLIGGYFTDKVSWRWCFLINLPIGAFAATIMLILGLNFGGVTYSWNSAIVICLIIFGLVVIGIFVVHQSKFSKQPIIPIPMFRIRNFWAVTSAQFCLGFSFFGLVYYLPLYDTVIHHGTASESGLFLLPLMLSFVCTSISTGFLMTITGRCRIFYIFGAILVTVGTGLMVTLKSDQKKFFGILFMVVCGIGNGLSNQSLIVCIQSSVPRSLISTATSTVMFMRSVSGFIGVAVILAVQRTIVISKLSLLAKEYPDIKDVIMSGVNDTTIIYSSNLIDDSIKAKIIQSFSAAFRCGFIILAAVSLVAVIFTLLTVHTSLDEEPQDPLQK
ncbi:hypothetical protein BB560_003290 [Smittium megazygosporum]|uniref:Major facilitator superfamily (MFS) profile domain-containing protein n=1 Tax=Smittium megazygosporum TaxID=133381 RepID=A0A2T9ZCI6_9FUNG|nr:hypothetical protein BB560_003290 [Smittium megazygosporum]